MTDEKDWYADAVEDYAVTEAMITLGGGFVSRLGAIYRAGDPQNQARLKAAFPEYWREYAALAKLEKHHATTDEDRAAITALEQDPERTNQILKWLVHLIGHTSCVGYAIAVTDGRVRTITCLRCGLSSFNQNDIDQKYCGHCHVFHEDAAR